MGDAWSSLIIFHWSLVIGHFGLLVIADCLYFICYLESQQSVPGRHPISEVRFPKSETRTGPRTQLPGPMSPTPDPTSLDPNLPLTNMQSAITNNPKDENSCIYSAAPVIRCLPVCYRSPGRFACYGAWFAEFPILPEISGGPPAPYRLFSPRISRNNTRARRPVCHRRACRAPQSIFKEQYVPFSHFHFRAPRRRPKDRRGDWPDDRPTPPIRHSGRWC